jgi:hypothetical protein
LRSAPYSFDWGDSIHAKVKATNIVGDSDYSAVGNGAIILTIPSAPVNLAIDTA